MTTAADIINQALKDIGVLGMGETATAEDATDGLDALNQMLGQWNATAMRPVDADLPVLSAADVISLPTYYLAALRYSLAELLKVSFPDATGRPDIAQQAAKARKIVKRKNLQIASLVIPCEVLPHNHIYYDEGI